MAIVIEIADVNDTQRGNTTISDKWEPIANTIEELVAYLNDCESIANSWFRVREIE